jgi:Short C-terminal domain
VHSTGRPGSTPGRMERWQQRIEELDKQMTLMGKDSVSVRFDGQALLVRRGLLDKKTYPVDEHVTAAVETGEALSSRPTLTRTATGAVIAGPLGALLGATAWKKTGSLFLVFEGRDWAELVELKPKKAASAQKLAQRVNLVARRAAPPQTNEGGAERDDVRRESSADVLDQLERLAKLREGGVLTDEEFTAEKRRILDR